MKSKCQLNIGIAYYKEKHIKIGIEYIENADKQLD